MITLYDHQKTAIRQGAEILKNKHLLYLSGEPRTGKTFTSLIIAQRCNYKKVLFITKKKAISSIHKDLESLRPSYSHHVINYESLHKVEDYQSFDLIICDEAHNMGAMPKPSGRAKKVRSMFYSKDIILMSGTPSPENYSQLYHQFYVSSNSPWSAYKNFYAWARQYVDVKQKMINSMMINDYTRAKVDLVKRDINPYIVTMSQEQAGFEAIVKESFLYVPMSIFQKSLYKEMEDDYYLSKYDITATNGADRINKLAQISSGTIIDNEGKPIIISVAKAHFIQQRFFDQKIAIFYKYQAELEVLKKFFNTTQSPDEFNAANDKVFVGQFQSIREGVNLRSADCIVMYNIDFSATSYFQSKARLQHKERKKEANIYWIFSEGGIEGYVYKAVSSKKSFTSSYYKRLCSKKPTQKNTYNQKLFNPLNLLDG